MGRRFRNARSGRCRWTFLTLAWTILILAGPFARTGAATPVRSWQPLAPSNVYAIASYRDLGGRIVAGATNGVWRTDNGGNSWQWAAGPIGPVGALLVDPSDATTIYAGTGLTRYDGASGTGLYRSRDGGTTWQRLPGIPSTDITRIVAQTSSPPRLWVGTGAGLFQSIDGGSSWEAVAGPFGSATIHDLAAVGTRLYAATGQGLYRTDDGGLTWSALPIPQLADGIVQVLASDPTRPSVLYAHGPDLTSACLLKTTDGGATWARIGAGLPCGDGMLIRSILVDPTAPDTVYLGTIGFGVYVSRDGGINWQQSPDLGGLGPTRDGNTVNALAPAYRSLLAGVGSGDSTGSGVYQSFDAGLTWRPLTSLAAGTTPIVTPDPFDPNVVFAVAHGRIYRSADSGQTWQLAVSGITAIDVSPVQQLIADPHTPGTLYAGTSQYGVFKSADGGLSWSRVTTDLAFTGNPITALAVDPTRAGVVYAGTFQDGLYQSTDGARTWLKAQLPFQAADDWHIRTIAIDPARSDDIYVTTEAGNVFRSRDMGQTWQILSSPGIRANALAVRPGNPATILLGADGGLYRSDDGGFQYTAVPAIDRRVNAILVASTTIILAMGGSGEDGIVRQSNDGGQTWQNVGPQFPGIGPALAVQVAPTDPSRLLVGTGAGSLWTLTIGRTASTLLDQTGGVLTSVDGRASLMVPRGVLSAPTTFTLTIALPTSHVEPTTRSIDPQYVLTASQDNKPIDRLPAGVMLGITYADDRVSPSIEADLTLARFSTVSHTWQPLVASTVNLVEDRVTAPVTQTGWFGLFGPHLPYQTTLSLVQQGWPLGW